jgi:hypothetical protein
MIYIRVQPIWANRATWDMGTTKMIVRARDKHLDMLHTDGNHLKFFTLNRCCSFTICIYYKSVKYL